MNEGGVSEDGVNDEREALEALVAILRDNELDALTLRRGDATYEIVAGKPGAESRLPEQTPTSAEHALAADEGVAAPPSAMREAATPSGAGPEIKKVTAPLIGVFYRAASPGAEPFVEVGARVEVGQPLCILEAMKLMNEITSDYAGIVRRVLPENGALVSLGEEMFWIEP